MPTNPTKQIDPVGRINLRRFALEFRQGVLGDLDPAFMCIAVCYPLASLLTLHGIAVRIVSGAVSHVNCYCYHTWLELPDRRVLDPTADQFRRPNGRSMPRVYFGPKPKWYFAHSRRKVESKP